MEGLNTLMTWIQKDTNINEIFRKGVANGQITINGKSKIKKSN